ncbi:hypothetical protein NR798_03885 [Archangium gephyra]|uniref:hypothetical protein n=1 Tax=Archangium gephyra TaxID=48 RepID=UPI0035D460C6
MRPPGPSEKQRATLHPWLPLLCGVPLAALLVWSLTPAEPPCAYVLGQDGPASVATPARVVFAPPEEAVPPEGDGAAWTCSNEGVRTPAIPVRVPTSVFENPESLMEVVSITLHLSSTPVSRPGHVLELEGGGLLVLPQPGPPASVPEGNPLAEPFITVDLGDGVRTARYVHPLTPGK